MEIDRVWVGLLVEFKRLSGDVGERAGSHEEGLFSRESVGDRCDGDRCAPGGAVARCVSAADTLSLSLSLLLLCQPWSAWADSGVGLVGGFAGPGSEGSWGSAACCRACQTVRARCRFSARSASRRVFPSVSLRARYARAGWCVRPCTTAITCSARLSWRLPPRSRRWRLCLPEDAGIGATPARRASFASELKRSAPAVSARIFAAVSAPQPTSSKSCGALACDECRDLAL